MRLLNSAVAAALAFSAPATAQAQNPRRSAPLVPGAWATSLIEHGDSAWNRLILRVDGDSIHAETAPPQRFALHGRVRGDSVDFVIYRDSADVLGRFRAAISDGRMAGVGTVSARRGEPPSNPAAWFAYPEPVRHGPPRAPVFEPQLFHRSFSGAIAPARRIFPGDTVRTKTIDAGGVDWNGVRRGRGGNPQTGPFFIEGAMPGDVIVVHLHRVRLNRDFAMAGQAVVDGAITTALALSLPDAPDFNSRWRLDRVRGVAILEQPTAALARYEIPLRPMLGCIAVAPPQKQSISTRDSGPFGGNMDYNELREGASVYLPVYEPGARLFIGDGHAAQGDGELTGDALETSMDVEFSVDVLRGGRIGAPRAQNTEYLMSIGIAGDLHEALRVATSDMIRWLRAEYKLSSPEVASVVGTAMRYDVADMVGTQLSIVAKVPRSVLAKLQPK
jgi:amidase